MRPGLLIAVASCLASGEANAEEPDVGVSAVVAPTPTAASGEVAADFPNAGGTPASSVLSRITVQIPFFTRHFPNDAGYNDHNWGAIVDYELTKHFGLAGGDFINSYRRNTAFVAGLGSPTVSPSVIWGLRPATMIGLDLNGGYRGFQLGRPATWRLHVQDQRGSVRGLEAGIPRQDGRRFDRDTRG